MLRGKTMFRKPFFIATIACLGIALSGCMGGASTMFRSDASHTGNYSGSAPTTLDKLDWKYTTADKTYSSPVVANGMVYLGCNDGNLYAIDQKTGQLKWKYKTGGNIEATPAVFDGTIYIGSWDKYLYAIDEKTRALRWKLKTDGPVSSSPVIKDGIIYFASEDGKL
ncbi:MAG TPA: hypothetical protein ENJ64_04830 [Thiotrichales bacterium]|nr:hypothetical protein [Thiotrichales bacterium]